MRTIFDPDNLWLGPPPMAQLSNSNKLPVAIDDALNVLRDSGPVTVDVLANDFDPEGQPLSLVSANAALGTAVAEADDTVTYTPPAGLTGFDTVVYTIADDLGQTRSGQINVTITEPQLSVDVQGDNTLAIDAATGNLDITVTTPAEFAGTYQIDVADLASGPINLVAPTISGSFATGQVLTADAGLWVYDGGAGLPLTSWQWRRAGSTDISGATSASYTVQGSDIGQGVSVRVTETDGFGQRSADSPVLGSGFTPASDGALLGWWDASDMATISDSGGAVLSWSDKAGGTALDQSAINARPQTGTRTLNGLNVIDFDGTDFLEAARSFPASGDVAFHMALVIDAIDNEYDAVLAVEATNDFQVDAGNVSTFVGRLNPNAIGSPTTLSGGPFSGGVILSLVFDRTGAATTEIFVSNTLRGTMAYTAPLDASAALHVMTNRSQNAWVDGAVAEIVVTSDVGNRADHHTYLAAKWGLI